MSDFDILFQVRSEKIDGLIERLSKLKPAVFKAIVDNTAEHVAVAMEQHAVIYPEARPESDYRRTGRLGASVTSEVRREGEYTYAVAGTNVLYAIWVVGPANPPEGEKGQAWMHKGVWVPLDESVNAHLAEYEDIIISDLEAAVKAFLP